MQPCYGTFGKFRELIGTTAERGARKGIASNERLQNGGVVQLVRTPACHVGGRGVRVPSLPPSLRPGTLYLLSRRRASIASALPIPVLIRTFSAVRAGTGYASMGSTCQTCSGLLLTTSELRITVPSVHCHV